MTTLRLEIKATNSNHFDFYNPASDDCKAYPRTEDGTQKAINKFVCWINDHRETLGITSAQIAIYEGKHEYYHHKEPFTIVPLF
jgi:hypothetical protein